MRAQPDMGGVLRHLRHERHREGNVMRISADSIMRVTQTRDPKTQMVGRMTQSPDLMTQTGSSVTRQASGFAAEMTQ